MSIARWIQKCDSINPNDSFINRLLVSKNIKNEEAGEFLSPQLSFLTSKANFTNLEKTAEIVSRWIKNKQKIIVFGDYDVDGVTSTVILVKAFLSLGADVNYYIPSRFTEGYGLSSTAVDNILQYDFDALITVDCGITSVNEVAMLMERGKEVIVTDHHNLPDKLPEPLTILNPKLDNKTDGHYNLCGAGVAYFLAMELIQDEVLKKELLQFAGVGTVADLVPLVDDNRIIAKNAILEIAQNPADGLKELINSSMFKPEEINSGHIGFRIAPRINATGRLASADKAVELFLSRDAVKRERIATELSELNSTRQEIERTIFEEAVKLVNSDKIYTSSGFVTVYSENWHEGVIGIVASRLVEKYKRPAVVFSNNNGILKGSGRSVPGFSIYHAMKSVDDLFIKFGGHDQALGLSMALSNFELFIERLKTYNDKHLTADILLSKINYDFCIEVSDINNDTVDEVELLSPFGIGNPKPTFKSLDFSVANGVVCGKNKDCIKFNFIKNDRVLTAMKFKAPNAKLPKKNQKVDLIYKISENTFNGVTSLQLVIDDFRVYSKDYSRFNRWIFTNFAYQLFNKFIVNGSRENNLPMISNKSIADIVKSNKKIVAYNFVDYLKSIYALIDLGIGIDEFKSRKGIANYLTAFEQAEDSENISTFFIAPTDDLEYRKVLIDEIINELYFDRRYFTDIYKYINNTKNVSKLRLISKSDRPLMTLVAIEFFKEAGFINLENDLISVIEKKHNKYNFEQSQIYKNIMDFAGLL